MPYLFSPVPRPPRAAAANARFYRLFCSNLPQIQDLSEPGGAAHNKKETELPLILNSKCVLSINFRPFENPPLESPLGKADFSSGELTFRHF